MVRQRGSWQLFHSTPLGELSKVAPGGALAQRSAVALVPEDFCHAGGVMSVFPEPPGALFNWCSGIS